MANDNRSLGRFHLEGIPSAPRGIPQVEVTFDLDADGILNVTAKDKATGIEQQIRITGQGGLDDSDIDRMVNEAETNEGEDLKKREGIEARNQAEALVYQTEKTLGEHRDKLAEEDVANVEEALAECRSAIEADDLDRIQESVGKLTTASHKLAEEMYKQASTDQAATPGDGGAAAGANGAAATAAKGDDVIDAEYEEA